MGILQDDYRSKRLSIIGFKRCIHFSISYADFQKEINVRRRGEGEGEFKVGCIIIFLRHSHSKYINLFHQTAIPEERNFIGSQTELIIKNKMNKLFSRKLVSRLSNSYANSLDCKDCASFSTLVRTHNQNHLFGSFVTRPIQDHSRSWSSHRSFAQKIHGFFSVPVVGKRFIVNPSNTYFKGSMKSVVESRSLFTGTPFSKLKFQLKPGFVHQWGGR